MALLVGERPCGRERAAKQKRPGGEEIRVSCREAGGFALGGGGGVGEFVCEQLGVLASSGGCCCLGQTSQWSILESWGCSCCVGGGTMVLFLALAGPMRGWLLLRLVF